MLCDICQRVASGFCPHCANYLCPDHGGDRCFRCHGAFMAVNPEQEPIETNVYTTDKTSRPTKGYLPCYTKPRIPTVYLDDPEPPGCYQCGELAEHTCRNCRNTYCPEHQGVAELCKSCTDSSNFGLLLFFSMLTLIGGWMTWMYFFGG